MVHQRVNAEAAMCNLEVAIGTFGTIKQLIFQKRAEGISEHVEHTIEDVARAQLADACHCLIKSTRDFLCILDRVASASRHSP